jgi:hypothetical protein
MITLIYPGPGYDNSLLQYFLAHATYGSRRHYWDAGHDGSSGAAATMRPVASTLAPMFAEVNVDLAALTEILDRVNPVPGPKSDEAADGFPGNENVTGRDDNTAACPAKNIVDDPDFENTSKDSGSFENNAACSAESTLDGALPQLSSNGVLHRLDKFASHIDAAAIERYQTLQSPNADDESKWRAYNELSDLCYLLDAREMMINDRFFLLAQHTHGEGPEVGRMFQLCLYHFWGTVLVPYPIPMMVPARDGSKENADNDGYGVQVHCLSFSSWELPINAKLDRMTRLL